jgi:hypothetical protein
MEKVLTLTETINLIDDPLMDLFFLAKVGTQAPSMAKKII